MDISYSDVRGRECSFDHRSVALGVSLGHLALLARERGYPAGM